MKIIELKVLGEKDKQGYLNYKELIGIIVKSPIDPRQGLSLDDVRKSNRILNALEKADKQLELEDADYNLLRAKLNAYRFPFAHQNIEEFADDILKAKKFGKK